MSNLPEALVGRPGTQVSSQCRTWPGYGGSLAFHRVRTGTFRLEKCAPATWTAIGASHGDVHKWTGVVLVRRNEQQMSRCTP